MWWSAARCHCKTCDPQSRSKYLKPDDLPETNYVRNTVGALETRLAKVSPPASPHSANGSHPVSAMQLGDVRPSSPPHSSTEDRTLLYHVRPGCICRAQLRRHKALISSSRACRRIGDFCVCDEHLFLCTHASDQQNFWSSAI